MADRVVIIGAGAVGAISAIEALKRGFEVTVVDRGVPGGAQAASYGNAAWLSSHSVLPPSEPGAWRKVPGYLADPLGPLAIRPAHFPRALPWLLRYLRAGSTEAKLARTAAALRSLIDDAPALHEAVAREAGVAHLVAARSGLLHVYRDRAAFLREARSWRIRRDLGIAYEPLDAAALRTREPALDPGYGFAVFVPEAGHCRDPGAYVAGLVAHAGRRGARFVRASATGFVIAPDGRLKSVTTDQGAIAADRAVIAAGVNARPLARAVGNRVPLESEGGYHVTLAAPEAAPRTPMMVADRKVVVTLTETGLRIAGQVEIGGMSAAPNWKRADILLRHLLGLFPDLRPKDEGRIARWHGHRPSTPDGLPVIGRSRASPDIIHAFGHGHVGLVASARTGRLVAALIAGAAPEIPLAPFDPRRF